MASSCFDLRPKRGRCHGLRENPQARAFVSQFRAASSEGRVKLTPVAEPPLVNHGLRTVGIVQIQTRRLREEVRAAAAARMLRIPLDLGGPPHVALHQQSGRNAVILHRRRVEKRPARNQFFGMGARTARFSPSEASCKRSSPPSPSEAAISFSTSRRLTSSGRRIGVRRKFVLQKIPVFFGVRHLLQTLPELRIPPSRARFASHFDQVDRLIRTQTLQSSSRFHRWHASNKYCSRLNRCNPFTSCFPPQLQSDWRAARRTG